MAVRLPGKTLAAERCLRTGSYFAPGGPSPAWTGRETFIPARGTLSRGAPSGSGPTEPASDDYRPAVAGNGTLSAGRSALPAGAMHPPREARLKVFVSDVDHTPRTEARGGPWTGPRKPFSGRKRQVNSPTPPYIDPARPAPPPVGPLDGLAAELSRREGPGAIDITRSSPPEEVLEQMAHADAINQRLREQGYQISFALSPDARSLQIELRDCAGTLLRMLSPEEAVELAAGRPLE